MPVPVWLWVVDDLWLDHFHFKIHPRSGLLRGWIAHLGWAVLVLVSIPVLNHLLVPLWEDLVTLISRQLVQLLHFLSCKQLIFIAPLSFDSVTSLACRDSLQLTWIFQRNLIQLLQIFFWILRFLIELVDNVFILLYHIFLILLIDKAPISIPNELSFDLTSFSLALKIVPLRSWSPVRAGPFSCSSILEWSLFVVYIHLFLNCTSRNLDRLRISARLFFKFLVIRNCWNYSMLKVRTETGMTFLQDLG